METFKLHNRTYKARELDFNFLCMLGENNVEATAMTKKIIPALRIYVAYCMDADVDIAGAEINNHVINGGTLEELISVFTQKIEDSDFFRALAESQKNTTASEKKSTKKNSEEEV